MGFANAIKAISNLKHISKAKILLSKHSPEILLVGGTVIIVGSAVYACRQTLKAHEVLAQANADLEDVESAIEVSNSEDYTAKDARKDRMRVYGRTFIDLAKCYGPSVIGGIIGFGMIFGGHKILRGRNVALATAYSTLLAKYKDYQSKVVNKLGEEEEFMLRTGAEKADISVVDENGNEIEVKDAKVIRDDGSEHSIYARVFDECNRNWSPNPAANLKFLRDQQVFANQKLISQGYLFLNDVLTMLGFPAVPDGQVVGWVYDPNQELDGNHDSLVDFGIYDILYFDQPKRDFINGYNPCVWLDFNVDGVMYNLI